MTATATSAFRHPILPKSESVRVEAFQRSTFRVVDPVTGLPRHFSNKASAECYATRLEIASAWVE